VKILFTQSIQDPYVGNSGNLKRWILHFCLLEKRLKTALKSTFVVQSTCIRMPKQQTCFYADASLIACKGRRDT